MQISADWLGAVEESEHAGMHGLFPNDGRTPSGADRTRDDRWISRALGYQQVRVAACARHAVA